MKTAEKISVNWRLSHETYVTFICIPESKRERGVGAAQCGWSLVCTKQDRSAASATHYRLIHSRSEAAGRLKADTLVEVIDLSSTGYSDEQLVLIGLGLALRLRIKVTMDKCIREFNIPTKVNESGNPSKAWVEALLRTSDGIFFDRTKPHLDDMDRIWSEIEKETEVFLEDARNDESKYGSSPKLMDGMLSRGRKVIPTYELRQVERMEPKPKNQKNNNEKVVGGAGFQVSRKKGNN